VHQSSLDKMRAFRKKYLAGREGEPLLILDLGSLDVNGSYKGYFGESCWTYRGIDLSKGPNVDIVLDDPYHWREVESGSADVVISGQAFEHIEFFWLTMLEIARVLKPQGLCCLARSIVIPLTAGAFILMDSLRSPVSLPWKFWRFIHKTAQRAIPTEATCGRIPFWCAANPFHQIYLCGKMVSDITCCISY
jgi:SAM-dependent methyltransferase